VLTHDALASRSPDRIESNPALTDGELMHDLEDARPTFEPDELTDPESMCQVSPARFSAPNCKGCAMPTIRTGAFVRPITLAGCHATAPRPHSSI
jgi:hypothetical protein